MEDNLICIKCQKPCSDKEDPCQALKALLDLYHKLRTEEKVQLIRQLRKDLNLVDYEVADDLRELGEAVIAKRQELHFIHDYGIRVGFVRSYEAKRGKGKTVFADCKKVTGTHTAYLPFDFILTFYEPNTAIMTDNQKKIIMLHELRHIGIGQRGLMVEEHTTEDFRDILEEFGLGWNDFNQEVPDILADEKVGGDNEKRPGEPKGKARK